MEYLTLHDIPHRHYDSLHSRRMASPESHRRSPEKALPSLAAQNHYERTSPPFQPGEHRPSQNSLPSFSQLIQKVREPSPPRTPSRRNGSSDSSPISKPQFDDFSWDGGKRRRVDTLVDMHRPSNASEHGSYDARRSSVVDPALSGYSSPRVPHQPVMHPTAPSHHHRPSLPYPTAPSNPGPSHVRHQSSPIPHGHAGYHPQPSQGHPALVAAPGYPPAPGHHAAAPYEHRGSYYQDGHAAPPHGHSYERPHDAYYGQPAYAAAPHAAYPNGYHPQAQYNYTFQSTLSMDQNSFNRKRRGNLPKEATNILKGWFSANRESPYPTEEQKIALCQQTGLSMNQVSNWFINARRRAPQKEQREARESNEE